MRSRFSLIAPGRTLVSSERKSVLRAHLGRTAHRRRGAVGAVVVAALLLSACSGYTTEATNIAKEPDGSYWAQLNSVGSCGSGENCSWYAQYRLVGTSTWTHVPATPHGPVTGPTGKWSLSEKVTGLAAGAQYEYQVCGNVQPGKPFFCVGPDGTPETTTKFTTAAWSLTTPSGGSLNGVSCTSAAACTAVGIGGLAERWNGSTWTSQTIATPSNSSSSTLSGVSCTSATVCTALGSYFDSTVQSDVNLAEGWNGSTWRILSFPGTDELSGISCTSATACTAVGSFPDDSVGDPVPSPLAERWDGTSWSRSEMMKGGEGTLSGVSCTSATACTVVGTFDSQYGPGDLAFAWDGTTWTMTDPPPNDTPDADSLSGVSCTSATACTAVGSDANFDTLADRWDGTSWTGQSTATPSGATSSNLSAVSCTSATACTAVGSYTNRAGTTVALVERWDGTSWTIQTTPNPSGATSSSLSAVSCTSAMACTAVGSYVNSAGTTVALADRYSV